MKSVSRHGQLFDTVEEMLMVCPILGHACVVDMPGGPRVVPSDTGGSLPEGSLPLGRTGPRGATSRNYALQCRVERPAEYGLLINGCNQLDVRYHGLDGKCQDGWPWAVLGTAAHPYVTPETAGSDRPSQKTPTRGGVEATVTQPLASRGWAV